ncbi:MAG: hypothetical protein RPU64_00200 [Candidatus Sedimenticola sp. (ex Thyasira tokunagai)]
MEDQVVWEVAQAVLLSVGGAGAILFGLSQWLGKLWAERLMVKESAAHESALAKLRTDLEHDSKAQLAEILKQHDIDKDTYLSQHRDKTAIYRMVVDMISDLLARLDQEITTGQPISEEVHLHFNRERIKVYGYLAMLAPQSVMDAQDRLIDYLMAVVNGREPYEWVKVRGFALELLNEVRLDVGIDDGRIEYNGRF